MAMLMKYIDSMKYDVFISYSSHDQEVVKRLCEYLEQHNIRCFVSYRDIPRGVVWASVIVEAMEQSRMMVVVFSEAFNNSQQVDREIEMASESHKPILTLRLSDAPFRAAKKYYLGNINWLDGFPEPDRAFGDVVANVARLLDIKLEDVKPANNSAKEVQKVEDKGVKTVVRSEGEKVKPKTEPVTPCEEPKKKSGAKWLYAVMLAVVAVGAALFFVLSDSSEAEKPAEVVADAAVEEVQAEEVETVVEAEAAAVVDVKEKTKGAEVAVAKERVAVNVAPVTNSVAEVETAAAAPEPLAVEEPVTEATTAEVVAPEVVAENDMEVVVATRYNIGDYYDDGNIKGVVFEVSDDGLHGKIVSLRQGNCCWGDVVEAIGATNKNDGQPNTNNMLKRADSEEFAAALWCRNQGSEWYLPSVSELKTLLLSNTVRKAVNKTLGERSATKLFKPGEPKSYWSSTEVDNDGHKAWEVSLYMKDASSAPKVMQNYVRAVARF